jgi:mannonate dehydratase
MPSSSFKRREFLSTVALGAATLGLKDSSSRAADEQAPSKRPVLMKAGHQHDHTPETLRALAAFGVEQICSGHLSARPDDWSVEALTRLRRHVESFGIRLAAVPLPMSPREISQAEMPDLLLDKEPARDRAIERICQMIRNAGKAGIPLLQYNLTFIGMIRTERVPGRGGASCAAFDYERAKQKPPLTAAGRITEDLYWTRITHFLERVVPVAEEAKVRIALHPQDPGMPKGKGFRGVETVLGCVEGLKRFIDTAPSPYHGLNFCQGTVSEMLEQPGEQIYDVIRWFGTRGKIFNVHFRNIRGGFLKFQETFPDEGDVDMPRALRVYRDCGYDGMIMPDHVPLIEGDKNKQKAFAFCFGYIQALLQELRAS